MTANSNLIVTIRRWVFLSQPSRSDSLDCVTKSASSLSNLCYLADLDLDLDPVQPPGVCSYSAPIAFSFPITNLAAAQPCCRRAPAAPQLPVSSVCGQIRHSDGDTERKGVTQRGRCGASSTSTFRACVPMFSW